MPRTKKTNQPKNKPVPITRDNCGKTKTCAAKDICKKDGYQSHCPCLINPSEVLSNPDVITAIKKTISSVNDKKKEKAFARFNDLPENKQKEFAVRYVEADATARRELRAEMREHSETASGALKKKGRKTTSRATGTLKKQAGSRHREWLCIARERLVEDRKLKNPRIKTFEKLAEVVHAQSAVLVVRQGNMERPLVRAVRDYLRENSEIRRALKK